MSKPTIVSALASCASLAMPPIGLGTLSIGADMVSQAIHSAIASGYRRIDCAPVYFNEDAIGDALASELVVSGNIKREDLFVVSKLPSPFHQSKHVEMALRKTLNDLRLEYLDLYLIHWPVAFNYVDIDPTKRGWDDEAIDESDGGNNIDPNVSVKETWSAMEHMVQKGLVRQIGVSNFPVALLHELMTDCKIKPAVNQVEIHPYLQQQKLLDYCAARGVHVQAYSPLGTPGYKEKEEPTVLEDAVLKEIAAARNIAVPQLCLLWALQRGCSVAAKSTSAERQKENLEAASLNSSMELNEQEMNRIAALDRRYRYFRPEDWWGSMAMAVFE